MALLPSCQALPFFGGGEVEPPKRTDTGELLAETGNLLSEFKWLILLILLFIPSARNAVGEFVIALFRGLALPFTVLVSRFSSTGVSLKKGEPDNTVRKPPPTEGHGQPAPTEPAGEPTHGSKPQ